MGVEDVLTKESARLGEARPHGPARRDATALQHRELRDARQPCSVGSCTTWLPCSVGSCTMRLPCSVGSCPTCTAMFCERKRSKSCSKIKRDHKASQKVKTQKKVEKKVKNNEVRIADAKMWTVDPLHFRLGVPSKQGCIRTELSIQNICNRGQDIDHSSTTAVAKAQQML
ncbi:hypothetical protein HAX54_003667 [Datura stramonium]|uniref:Uncharacterized protein n=1 Tax=Datura stramonium TaxID=4076 RepID=A0ABS8WUG4_DATST|nr:hypothetical protein [Datura stramonium]